MLQYTIIFILGVHIGQEYHDQIPNIKKTAIQLYKEFKNNLILL